MHKRFLALLLGLVFMAGATGQVLAAEEAAEVPQVYIDGVLTENVHATVIDQATYVSFTALVSALQPDAVISWEGGQSVARAEGIEVAARPGAVYLQANGRYLYVPEDELKLSYEVDEKYNADQMAEIINEYKKDLFLDAENWFAEMKVMGDKLGYCPNVKEYKKNPDAYKGSITDVCTIVRVAVTGKKNSPDLATIMNVIGKDRTIGRLDKFLAAIGK